jgi:mannose-6-phosphate isomerase-like protein (cupin superfamily)
MANPMTSSFDLSSTYIHLQDGPGAIPVEVSDDFWTQIDSRLDLHDGRLVTTFHFQNTDDWAYWEMHPAGDEIVYLLSGAVDLVLHQRDEERIVELRNRAACIIPQGAWHRAIIHRPSDALFITRGAGTQHRAV